MTKDGETIEEAKVRLEQERMVREQEANARMAEIPKIEILNANEIVAKSMHNAKEITEAARKAAGLE